MEGRCFYVEPPSLRRKAAEYEGSLAFPLGCRSIPTVGSPQKLAHYLLSDMRELVVTRVWGVCFLINPVNQQDGSDVEIAGALLNG